jgi:hypothetical protein
MAHDKDQTFEPRAARLSVRMTKADYSLVDQAAENQGLEISSFIIMLLVRLHILPDSYLKRLKRRPVPLFTELHDLIGAVNKIAGNCKQLVAARPETPGLRSAQASLQRAAAAITDALHGKTIPVGVNLHEMLADLTEAGYVFNDIVRSINMGQPELSGLRSTLAEICKIATTIAVAFTGKSLHNADTAFVKDLAELAMEEMRANMRKAERKPAKRSKDDD